MMPRLLITTTLSPAALQHALDQLGLTMHQLAPSRPAGTARLVDADFTSLQDAPTPIRAMLAAIDGIQQALPVPDAHPG